MIAIRIAYGGYSLLCGSIFFMTAIPAIAAIHTIEHPIICFASLDFVPAPVINCIEKGRDNMPVSANTVTIVIALAAIVSPILVAIINNIHHTKIRKMELFYDGQVRQFEIYYADKKAAFSDFIDSAGAFSSRKEDLDAYARLQSALNKATLFCDDNNQSSLCEFSGFIDSKAFSSNYGSESRKDYSVKLNAIARSLNKELESTKPSNNIKTRH